MRSIFAFAVALPLALAGCGSNTAPATGTPSPVLQSANVTPILQIAVGTAFTVAQGAAKAYIAAHPTAAAGVQAGLTAAQQAFLAWVNAPAGTTGQQAAEAALQAATTSLLTSLATQGVKF